MIRPSGKRVDSHRIRSRRSAEKTCCAEVPETGVLSELLPSVWEPSTTPSLRRNEEHHSVDQAELRRSRGEAAESDSGPPPERLDDVEDSLRDLLG